MFFKPIESIAVRDLHGAFEKFGEPRI